MNRYQIQFLSRELKTTIFLWEDFLIEGLIGREGSCFTC